MLQGFVVESFGAAEDLLSALARRDARWSPFPEDWIFRGQPDSRWHLIPSAHRPATIFRYGVGREYQLRPEAEAIQQVGAEASLIRFFVRELDRAGLPLPGETALRWRDLISVFGSLASSPNLHDWPPEDIAPLFALAQHYGVPTRLLDWSDRPFVAAYFAAAEAASRWQSDPDATANLSVWALGIARVKALLMGDIRGSQQPQLRLVRPPRAQNANLRAQDGVFTLLADTSRGRHSAYIPPPIDELILERLEEQQVAGNSGMAPLLYRLDLPLSQAGTLLRLLAQEFVSATQLYPGLAGVVAGMRERALWDRMGHVPGD